MCIRDSAQPGGGFDLTCRLATEGLKQSGALKSAMRIVYMPGGIGAVAYNNIVAQHPNEPGTIVAFSGGSLLNLCLLYTSSRPGRPRTRSCRGS